MDKGVVLRIRWAVCTERFVAIYKDWIDRKHGTIHMLDENLRSTPKRAAGKDGRSFLISDRPSTSVRTPTFRGPMTGPRRITGLMAPDQPLVLKCQIPVDQISRVPGACR